MQLDELATMAVLMFHLGEGSRHPRHGPIQTLLIGTAAMRRSGWWWTKFLTEGTKPACSWRILQAQYVDVTQPLSSKTLVLSKRFRDGSASISEDSGSISWFIAVTFVSTQHMQRQAITKTCKFVQEVNPLASICETNIQEFTLFEKLV